MEITVSQDQGRVPVTVFHLEGNLITDEELVSQARQAYEAGTRNLLIDLTRVDYLSSAGLRALHNIFVMLRGETPDDSLESIRTGINKGTYKSPHLKLLNPSKNSLKAIQTTGYDMFIDIFNDYKKAIASF